MEAPARVALVTLASVEPPESRVTAQDVARGSCSSRSRGDDDAVLTVDGEHRRVSALLHHDGTGSAVRRRWAMQDLNLQLVDKNPLLYRLSNGPTASHRRVEATSHLGGCAHSILARQVKTVDAAAAQLSSHLAPPPSGLDSPLPRANFGVAGFFTRLRVNFGMTPGAVFRIQRGPHVSYPPIPARAHPFRRRHRGPAAS